MKPQLQDKDVLTVQEAVEHFKLSRRKFYALLKEEGLPFVAFYFNGRRLILRSEFVKYLAGHPEIRRREPKCQESQG
ncbi:helix-turn-helix domain-containing protein [Lachnospiraceae bacterium JLR.KK009]|nr:excisionase family DNA binding domain-containing protein [Lachnospiraceae bacterium A2]